MTGSVFCRDCRLFLGQCSFKIPHNIFPYLDRHWRQSPISKFSILCVQFQHNLPAQKKISITLFLYIYWQFLLYKFANIWQMVCGEPPLTPLMLFLTPSLTFNFPPPPLKPDFEPRSLINFPGPGLLMFFSSSLLS